MHLLNPAITSGIGSVIIAISLMMAAFGAAYKLSEIIAKKIFRTDNAGITTIILIPLALVFFGLAFFLM